MGDKQIAPILRFSELWGLHISSKKSLMLGLLSVSLLVILKVWMEKTEPGWIRFIISRDVAFERPV